MTTHEKLQELIETLSRVKPNDLPPDVRSLVYNFQALKGAASIVGVSIPANPLTLILPDDPADADVLVDKLIGFLLEIRGDDLPPFDPNRYGERGLFATLLEDDEPETEAA